MGVEIDLEISPTIIDGNLEACYFIFRRGFRAQETIEFHHPDNPKIRLKIDVGSDQLPLALEQIGFTKIDKLPIGARHVTREKLGRDLFMFAMAMIKMHDLGRTSMANDFVDDVVDKAAAEELCCV